MPEHKRAVRGRATGVSWRHAHKQLVRHAWYASSALTHCGLQLSSTWRVHRVVGETQRTLASNAVRHKNRECADLVQQKIETRAPQSTACASRPHPHLLLRVNWIRHASLRSLSAGEALVVRVCRGAMIDGHVGGLQLSHSGAPSHERHSGAAPPSTRGVRIIHCRSGVGLNRKGSTKP